MPRWFILSICFVTHANVTQLQDDTCILMPSTAAIPTYEYTSKAMVLPGRRSRSWAHTSQHTRIP